MQGVNRAQLEHINRAVASLTVAGCAEPCWEGFSKNFKVCAGDSCPADGGNPEYCADVAHRLSCVQGRYASEECGTCVDVYRADEDRYVAECQP